MHFVQEKSGGAEGKKTKRENEENTRVSVRKK